jgi:hypothetical protein
MLINTMAVDASAVLGVNPTRAAPKDKRRS